MQMTVTLAVNAPSGNNQTLTLKPLYGDVRPSELGIGLTSIVVNYSGAPKGDFWKTSASEGSEYYIEIHRRMKS